MRCDRFPSDRNGHRSDDFFRLFLLPGVHHCAGGPGPDVIDAIGALEAWVERGIAPEVLVASGG